MSSPMLPILPFLIDPSSFKGKDGVALDGRDTDGGLPSVRLDVIGSKGTANVTWFLTTERYRQFTDFFFDTIEEGSKPFLLPLAFDYSTPQLNEARFIPGSVSLDNMSGMTMTVSAQLEVKPNYEEADDWIVIELIEQYSLEELKFMLLSLNKFVNIEAPKWID